MVESINPGTLDFLLLCESFQPVDKIITIFIAMNSLGYKINRVSVSVMSDQSERVYQIINDSNLLCWYLTS